MRYLRWAQLLQSMSEVDLKSLKSEINLEEARREGRILLSAEECQMGKIDAIRSVRDRLKLDLLSAKRYVEAAYNQQG